MNKFGFEEVGHYATYIKPHMAQIAARVKTLESGLPPHAPTLDPEIADLVLAEPLGQIRTVSSYSSVIWPFELSCTPDCVLFGKKRFDCFQRAHGMFKTTTTFELLL